MCGRYVRRSDKQRIAEHFHVYGPSVPDFGSSWNVAPQTFQPVVRLNRDTREREIVMMRWGLIPFWAKDPKIGLQTINAKAETVATASSFREAFRRRQCLVPTDAFLEWQKIDAKTKQPFAIALKSGEPYALAGFDVLNECQYSLCVLVTARFAQLSYQRKFSFLSFRHFKHSGLLFSTTRLL
jgi:putative SOS response-associated peptidase YedK